MQQHAPLSEAEASALKNTLSHQKFVVVGDITCDLQITCYSRRSGLDGSLWFQELSAHARPSYRAGAAGLVAMALGDLGLEVFVYGAVGGDAEASAVKKHLPHF